MNNKQLCSILKEEIQYESLREDSWPEHCTSFLEKSTSQHLCFYNLKEGELYQKILMERLAYFEGGIIIFNRSPNRKLSIPHLVLKEHCWMEAQKKVCDYFYPVNWGRKKIIGVTGTNGKTTTVYLALQILHQLDKRAFSIGSLGVRSANKMLQDLDGMTTPPYIEMRKILFEYFKDDDFCIMEVSSHALEQQRIYKILYDAAGWTNFGQDHLDYHHSLDDYFEQKKKLPRYHMKKGKKILVSKKERELTRRLSDIPIKFTGEIRKLKEIIKNDFFNVFFNQENLKLAVALVEEVMERKIQVDINQITPPPGRFEVLKMDDKMAIVDSAHTPDAMEQVLRAIRTAFPLHKLITIFGCGGDRDHLKRPLMGKIAEENSDITIVTSDNPRSEKADNIIKHIVSGMDQCDYCERDRSKAIALGVSLLSNCSLLVILGKGAEMYQILGDKIKDFSDVKQFYKHVKKLK